VTIGHMEKIRRAFLTRPLWLIRLSYWVRPFDTSLDARRWRWSTPGCVRSRRIFQRAVLKAICDHRDYYFDAHLGYLVCSSCGERVEP
jgi:hypothetical protein